MHIFLKNQCQKVKTCWATNLHSVFVLIMLNQQTVYCRNLLKHINHAVTQDIRRFFQPTSAKPAVQRSAPSGGIKTKKKKNPLSSDEEVKKKETVKVRESSSVLFVVLICLFHHLIHHVLLCFICFRGKAPNWMRSARIVRKNERSMQS